MVAVLGLGLALAAPAGAAARYESWAFKATISESARFSLDSTTSCYVGGNYVRDAPVAVRAQFRSTAVYDPVFVNTGNPIFGGGNANAPDRRTAGTWTYGSACGNHSGTVGEVDSKGGPNGISTKLWTKLEPADVRFQVPPAYFVGAVGPDNFIWFEVGGTGACCGFGPPPGGGTDAAQGLVATASVPRRELTALTSGSLDRIDIPVRGPRAPWTVPPCLLAPGCTQQLPWTGTLRLEPICDVNVPTGKGYGRLSAAMKSALKRLYREIERRHGCYRFTVGYRSQAEQDRLRRRWHDVADRRGSGDHRSQSQVCAALKGAGFAQCPAGRDRDGDARGGPAIVSRHTSGQAADVTVRWPPAYKKDLGRYQEVARRAGLCGPPAGDPVHVELPYAKGHGHHRRPVRCHFPEGPAP